MPDVVMGCRMVRDRGGFMAAEPAAWPIPARLDFVWLQFADESKNAFVDGAEMLPRDR